VAKVLLLDGLSLLFRAYHAMPPMTTKEGKPTGALYGFLRLMYNVIDKEHPDLIGVCLDVKGPTFRKEALVEYKANRPPPDEDMVLQIQDLPQLLADLGIPVVFKQGFEADDVIATVAKIEKKKGNQIVIVSGDKDILQTVEDGVTVYINKKGVSEMEPYNIENIKDKLQMTPQQFVWYKALKGDTTDNYPGVPGIGEKTALEIASKALNVENVEDHPKVQKNLEIFKQSLMLATVREDVPIDFHDETLNIRPDPDRAIATLKRYEFRTLVGRFSGHKPHPKPVKVSATEASLMVKEDFALATTESSIQILSGDKLLEIETGTGLFANPDQALMSLQKPFQSNLEKYVVDLKELVRRVTVSEPTFDVQLAAYLDDPGHSNYDLTYLATTYLDDSPSPAQIVFEAGKKLEVILKEKNHTKLLLELEQPLSRVLALMEDRGIMVDKVLLKKLGDELEKGIKEKSEQVYKDCGCRFNIGSPKQLQEVLFVKMGLEPLKKTKTGFSTSASVLEQLAEQHTAIALILEVRELTKLKNTYVDTLPTYTDKESRVHTIFLQTGTSTGRLSSVNPNLQNIPIRSDWGSKIRECFVAKPGFLIVSADYSQIDLRMLAHLSEDPELIRAFKAGEDIHEYTAKRIFGVENVSTRDRRGAKIINFGVLYGMSAHRLSNEFGVTYKEADKFIKDYFERFAGVSSFIKRVCDDGRKLGYTETILGRRRYIPELLSNDFQIRSAGERAAINSPVQGSAADVIKLAMLEVEESLKGTGAGLILQIHDELVIECPEDKAETVGNQVNQIMENAYKAKIPITSSVHIGRNLLEAK